MHIKSLLSATAKATVGGLLLLAAMTPAHAGDCMKVTLTGTMGGPPTFDGRAGAGTLVRYGDESNDCDDVRLQFDAGRGTNLRLSELGLKPSDLDAVFITHVHSDHVDGLADMLQHRWHFAFRAPNLDVVCSNDAETMIPPTPDTGDGKRTMSCEQLLKNIAAPYFASGEIDQRRAEQPLRPAGGPYDKVTFMPFTPGNTAAVVWTWLGGPGVTVSAIRSQHIAGHASYRVDTPAGSVVIGGDAGNDNSDPNTRPFSTSENVELLADGVDVIVHSTIHPVMGVPGATVPQFPPPVFARQSTAGDLGAMANRVGASHLMLTHLIPPPGAPAQAVFTLVGGPVQKNEYKQAAKDGGFKGKIIVGTDLATVRIPSNKGRN